MRSQKSKISQMTANVGRVLISEEKALMYTVSTTIHTQKIDFFKKEHFQKTNRKYVEDQSSETLVPQRSGTGSRLEGPRRSKYNTE